MGKTGSNKRNPYAGARLILLQDSVLCMLASLLSILLVRSLSEPIPGFSVLVWRFLAAALAGSLIGSAVSGLWKMEVRSLNAHLFGVFLLLILSDNQRDFINPCVDQVFKQNKQRRFQRKGLSCEGYATSAA